MTSKSKFVYNSPARVRIMLCFRYSPNMIRLSTLGEMIYNWFKQNIKSHESSYFHLLQVKLLHSQILNLQGNRAILLLCIGYNYNVYIINSLGFWKYSMTNSSGSSQCDPELAIPGIFWHMETKPSRPNRGSWVMLIHVHWTMCILNLFEQFMCKPKVATFVL